MLRDWFQRRAPDQAQVILRLQRQMGNHAFMEKMLREPNLWQLDRRTVAGGVAVGLFVSWLPMPLQTVVAVCLSALMRVHVPISMVMVWFTNPLTIVPLLYAAWFVGSSFMPSETTTTTIMVSAQTSGLQGLIDAFLLAWPVLLLGCLLCACLTSALGYLLVHAFWREDNCTDS